MLKKNQDPYKFCTLSLIMSFMCFSLKGAHLIFALKFFKSPLLRCNYSSNVRLVQHPKITVIHIIK